jgi:hypothetical protein
LLPGVQSQRFVAAPRGVVFPGDPGAPDGVYFPDKNNFAPRIGLAWDPFGSGKTSVRGGFGIFYNILNGWIQFGSSSWFTDAHLRTPYVYNFNLSVERQLIRDLAIDVSYVGSRGQKLTNQVDQNPTVLGTNIRLLNAGIYPYYNDPDLGLTDNGFSPLPNFTTNAGKSSYDGLLASLTKRFSDTRGIGTTFFTLAYTWSHNIDNGSGAVTTTAGNIPYYNYYALEGNSNFDQRQRLTLSGGVGASLR